MNRFFILNSILFLLFSCSDDEPSLSNEECKLENVISIDENWPKREYKFNYNQAGQVISTEIFDDDSFVVRIEGEYNSKGNLVKIYAEAIDVDYDYYVELTHTNSEIKEISGTISSGVKNENDYSYVYKKNSQDQIVEVHRLQDNEQVIYRTFVYKDENIVKMTGAFGGPHSYEYNNSHNPQKDLFLIDIDRIYANPFVLSKNHPTKKYNGKGELTDTWELEYTKDGLLRKSINTDKYDISSMEFFYSCH